MVQTEKRSQYKSRILDKKIERNIKRDKEVNIELTNQGWTILRFRTNDINKNLLYCVTNIEKEIEKLAMNFKEKYR